MKYWLFFVISFWIGVITGNYVDNTRSRFSDTVAWAGAIVTGLTILYLLGLGIYIVWVVR